MTAAQQDRTHFTRGLPAPDGPVLAERVFEWEIRWPNAEPASLWIPRTQCGQTDWIARDSDQAAWIGTRADWLRAVWDCVWEFTSEEAVRAFEAALAPLACPRPIPQPRKRGRR